MPWVRWWAVAAAAITVMAVLGYAVAQQTGRRAADDVPRAIVSQWADRLAHGEQALTALDRPPVDLTSEAAPFTIVYDDSHAVLASTATVQGRPPVVPPGVLDGAVAAGRDQVTWQPQPGIRTAVVAVPWHGTQRSGVVLSGVGLGPTEDRATQVGALVLLAWAVLLALTAAVFRIVPRWRLQPRAGGAA